MKQQNKRRYESGQSIVLIALAMLALVAIVGVALDGAIAYWNLRRAQNGADAGAIAGVGALINGLIVIEDGLKAGCGTGEDAILTEVYKHATNNEVPDDNISQNVKAFYLVKTSADTWDVLTHDDGSPWELTGGTNSVPCDTGGQGAVAGLMVRTQFPQTTFLSGILGIYDTNVVADAYATWEYEHWCTDFAVFAAKKDGKCSQSDFSITGSDMQITNGGLHSNCGFKIAPSGTFKVELDQDRPFEWSELADGSAYNVNNDKIQWNCLDDLGNRAECPEGTESSIDPVVPYDLPGDLGYEMDDFRPGGEIWNEADPSERFYFKSGIKGDKDLESDFYGNSALDADDNPKHGLYVVEGEFAVNGLKKMPSVWRATLATTGPIKISGGFNQLPYSRGIFIYTESDDTSSGAVDLSGNSNHWAGLILAPNGLVSMSASDNSDLAGMILGYQVSVSGSASSINHRPEYCPQNPPRILLTQ